MTLYFSVEYVYYNNWDFLGRIVNAKFIFSGGPYIYINNSIFETALLGVLMLLFGTYSVYAYLLLFSVLLIYACTLVIKLMQLKMKYAFVIVSPFLLFWGLKNGSEIPVITFLLFTFYLSVRRSPLSGVTMALAILSKFYAVFFLPILLIGIERKRRFIFYVFAAITLLILTMMPYFAFMYRLTGYATSGMALSFWSTEGLNPDYGAFMLSSVELVPFAALILLRRSSLKRKVKTRPRVFIGLFLMFAISIYVAIDASKLAIGIFASNQFRFTLPSSVFLSIIASPLFRGNRQLAIYSVASFALATVLLIALLGYLGTSSSFINAAKLAYASVFYNKTCVVQSNNWIYFDYVGIPSIPVSLNASIFPVISNYALPNSRLINESGFKFYEEGRSCVKGRILFGTDTIIFENATSKVYYMNLNGKYEQYSAKVFNPCAFAFGKGILYSVCMFPNYLLRL
ncbi:MAG: hypothetical protein QXP36_11950 [Conexivisphaerales archaeon]